MWITSSIATALKPTAIALGNFDGIHRGHQRVVQPILEASAVITPSPSLIGTEDYQQQPDKERSFATVVSFNPHPREFFTGQSRQLLTPLPEKVKQLERLGVEQLVLLPFDQKLSCLSPQQFVAEILVEKLQATHISVGEDFRFGHKRAGNARDLKAIARQFGVEVIITKLHNCQGNAGNETSVRISSSLIRKALSTGDIITANRLLGREYSLIGQVIKGKQLGRTIGFPTANLELPKDKLIPRQGVYCVKVDLNSELAIKGVMNIGSRPTVEGTNLTVEVHLLDWSGDLYNQEINVNLIQFLRPEQKFSSLDALKAQITADCELARHYLSHYE